MELTLTRILTRPPAYITAEDDLPNAKNFAWEQEESYPDYRLLRQSISWLDAHYTDEDPSTPLKNFANEQEESYSLLIVPQEQVLWGGLCYLDEDPCAGYANFAREQEEAYPLRQQVVYEDRVTFLDDEISSQLKNFSVEEEYLPPPLVCDYRVYIPATLDTEEFKQPSVTIPVEEEYRLPIWGLSVSWGPQALTDDETGSSLKNFSLEYEDAWPALTVRVPWSPAVTLDDEIGSLLSNFGVEYEDLPPTLTLSITWAPQVSLDDEIGGSLKYFSLEYEDLPPSQVVRGVWLPVPSLDDEIAGNLPNPFYLEYEDLPPALIVSITWLPRTSLDDEIGSTLKNFGLEQEEYWGTQTLGAWVVYVRPAGDGEGELSRTLGLEQEDSWLYGMGGSGWYYLSQRPSLAIPDQEEPLRVSPFSPVDQEEPWGNTLRVSMPWNPMVFSDEAAQAQLKNFYLDHHEYLEPRITRPYTPPYQALSSPLDDGGFSFVGGVVYASYSLTPKIKGTLSATESLTGSVGVSLRVKSRMTIKRETP